MSSARLAKVNHRTVETRYLAEGAVEGIGIGELGEVELEDRFLFAPKGFGELPDDE